MKNLKIIFFLIVFVFTFILRAHNYEKTPTSNHLDEMLYAWSGLFLIETGTPVSWSTLNYPKRAEVFKGEINYKGDYPKASVTLYSPWLDQPPVFSYIVGYFAHIYHADRHQFIPSSYIRMPTVIFATLTSVLIFLIATSVGNYWQGLLAMFVYGVVPVFVFGVRTALPENLIAFIYALLFYLLLRYKENGKRLLLLVVPWLIIVAGLSKPTGFFLLPIICFFILAFRKYKSIANLVPLFSYFLVITAIGLGIFFWYGNHFDSEIFKTLTTTQSNRPVGFAALPWFFISPAYRTDILKDGSYVFCLLSLAYFLIRPPKDDKRYVVLAAVFWILVVMISGGEGDLLPWYRFGAFPFLAIIGSWGIIEIYKRSDIFATFLAGGLLLSTRSLLVNPFRPNFNPLQFRMILASILAPSFLQFLSPKSVYLNLSRVVVVLVLLYGTLMNIQYIYNQYEIVCENLSCSTVPTTFLSRLYFPVLYRFIAFKP